MNCKHYKGEQDFQAFVCDMGIKKVDQEQYDRLLLSNKNLLAKNKQLNGKIDKLVKGLMLIASNDCCLDDITYCVQAEGLLDNIGIHPDSRER